MAINKKLIHFKKYSDFIGSSGTNGATSPTNGYYHNIPETSIVFIQDTNQIWTHGTFYDGSTVNLSNIEESIQNKADKTEIPTKTSQLTNDSDFITADSISDMETKTNAAATYQVKGDYITTVDSKNYTDTAIANLVDSAPETLNTLNELATAITEHQGVTDALDAAITNKVDKVDGKGLSTNDYTTEEKSKLAGIAAGAQVNTITGVKGNSETTYRTGDVNITAANLGITVINNTADSDKSVKYATTAGSATKDANGNTITSYYATASSVTNKQDKNIYFTNVSASSWVSDSTYSDFPYRCDIACTGVTADMYAEVIFDVTEAQSGNYAPICETKSGAVAIWSKENTAIQIPTITITK